MDRQLLETKLQEFCQHLELEVAHGYKNRGLLNITPPRFGYEIGYKYALIYREHFTNVDQTETQRIAQFRVAVHSAHGDIYGVKSWNQVNTRRWYGDLESFDEWSWAFSPNATPKPGTLAEIQHGEREQQIRESHKQRGRPPTKQKEY